MAALLLEQKTYLTEDEAAQLFSVSVHKLRKDRMLGQGLPYVKLNRLVRYHRPSCEQQLLEGNMDVGG